MGARRPGAGVGASTGRPTRRRRHPRRSRDDLGDLHQSSDALALNNAGRRSSREVSCQNAWPEDTNNLGYALLKNGAIATYGGTRNTWYTYGTWTGSKRGDNASYAYYITQETGAEPDDGDARRALQWCRENLSTGLSGSASYFMNRTDFNLYGDPSIKLGRGRALNMPEMDVLGNLKEYSRMAISRRALWTLPITDR